ncbi:MAG: hypothetical protein ACC658_02595 [Acidimicrobiia bacterium]
MTELKELADTWIRVDDRVGVLECRHFFSGAAVYREGSIVASLTPVGLAFKVPSEVHDSLLSSGRAAPLRYFPTAPIKRDYVLFSSGSSLDPANAARLILGDHPLP